MVAASLLVLAALAALAVLGVALLHHPKSASPSAQGAGSAPANPPAAGVRGAAGIVHVCGNSAILGGGPATAPRGAITVPAGDNNGVE